MSRFMLCTRAREHVNSPPGVAEHEAGPSGEKERRLAKLGTNAGAGSEDGACSHGRKLLGASEEEILHAVVLALIFSYRV